MTSLTPDLELYNFITSWELIKTAQNFVQGSFSIKSLKLTLSTGVAEYFSIKPLLVNYCSKALHIRCFCGFFALNAVNDS